MKTPALLLSGFLLLCSIPPTYATDYYVSNSGNDGNNGLTPSSAFLTLQYAADQLLPGDHVFVEDGIYAGFALWQGGIPGAPIVFQALANDAVINTPCSTNDGINIENADYVIIDGFIVKDQPRNGIRLANADYCMVRYCICDNNFDRGIFTAFTDDIVIEYNICSNSQDEHGIYVSNSSDRPLIRYNECFGNNNIGIHLNADASLGDDGIISDAVIYGNIIHDNNLAAGINMDGLENPVVFNNLIYNNHFAQGIALFQQDGAIVTSGAKIYNNTIVVPNDGRWGILLKAGANANTEIYNNIIINQHAWRGCISAESTTGLSSNYNIFTDAFSNMGDGIAINFSNWQALGFDANSLLASDLDALFTDPLNVEFHLPDLNSLAVNNGNGSLVSTWVHNDVEGNLRPDGTAFDIGAYELQNITSSTNMVLSSTCIEILPNPSDEIFTIEGILAEYFIRVLDAAGNLVTEIRQQDNIAHVDLSLLGSGIYFIQVIHPENGRLCVEKIIKK